jgi:hypothetical protein
MESVRYSNVQQKQTTTASHMNVLEREKVVTLEQKEYGITQSKSHFIFS